MAFLLPAKSGRSLARSFGASAIFAWFPIQTSVSTANLTTSVLFEGAVGLLAIGFITAPVMDIILHVDIDKK